jgi:hypothetical protein
MNMLGGAIMMLASAVVLAGAIIAHGLCAAAHQNVPACAGFGYLLGGIGGLMGFVLMLAGAAADRRRE